MSRSFNLWSTKEILPRLLTMNTMVYNAEVTQKNQDNLAVPFFNLRSKKILPRLTMNSMVYTSTIFKCWGYPEKSEWPRCPVFSTFVRQKKYYQGRWPWIPWFTIQPYLNDSYPEKSGRPRCPVFSTFNPQKNITKVVDHEHHGLQFNHI